MKRLEGLGALCFVCEEHRQLSRSSKVFADQRERDAAVLFNTPRFRLGMAYARRERDTDRKIEIVLSPKLNLSSYGETFKKYLPFIELFKKNIRQLLHLQNAIFNNCNANIK